MNDDEQYQVALNDFLLTGKEKDMCYLIRKNKCLSVENDEKNIDIRIALIEQLKAQFGESNKNKSELDEYCYSNDMKH